MPAVNRICQMLCSPSAEVSPSLTVRTRTRKILLQSKIKGSWVLCCQHGEEDHQDNASCQPAVAMRLSPWFPLLLVGAVLAQASASTSVAKEAERKASKVKPFTLDGVNVDSLSQKDLAALLEAEDEKLAGEIDIWTGKRDLALLTKGGRKRWLPALFTVGRTLLGSAAVRGLTKSGIRLTRQYVMKGKYRNALKWFNRLKPTNVRPLPAGSKYRGYTGRMGKRQVTVRNGSSGGQPTLEIRSPRRGNRQFVHKFRFEKKRGWWRG